MNNQLKTCSYVLPVVAWLLALFPTAATAQAYPNKPVRLMTGSAAGGGGDLTSRAIAQKLSASLGQQVIVDDRPGATGMIANQLLARAAPDGYTILLQPSSFICISPHLNSQEGWDPSKNVAGIIQVSAYGLVVVVHPSVPAKTVKELIAIAEAKPGVLNFATSGVGSNFHLGAEIFKLRAKVNMVHVPYRGSTAAVIDLIAGRADVMFGLVPVLNPYIKEGKLRAIAFTARKRNVLLPDVPTVGESLPGYSVESWEGVVAPAVTPRDIIARLNQEIAAAVNSAELRELWKNRGVDTVTGTAEEFSAKLKEDYERYGDLLKRLGVNNPGSP
ncbi:MAG: tripartite tricarboxylate transporter substrate binding protein [Betaproteobacteria bacterium]|nr:tripartite tricarboxylate transporter substrate binding protein [Betaproteobacteria bacterium]